MIESFPTVVSAQDVSVDACTSYSHAAILRTFQTHLVSVISVCLPCLWRANVVNPGRNPSLNDLVRQLVAVVCITKRLDHQDSHLQNAGVANWKGAKNISVVTRAVKLWWSSWL